MKKIIFGIFAHPDDEAFGPAGALLKATRSGSELHLITLTAGDAGTNPDDLANLGEVRLEEWKKAGALLGATNMHFLGYKDGQLNNLAMIEAAARIGKIVTEAIETAPEDAEIEFMSLDLNGLTGHIDHIVAARAACLAFYTLKKSDGRFTRIHLACLPAELYPKANIDWIYMERGRTAEEIDETVDARELRDDIIEVMRTHHSQRGDCEYNLKTQGDRLGLNHFIVKS